MRGLEAMMVCLVGVVLLAVAGCTSDPYSGYSAMSVFPEGISSVSVPIFKNETYVRDVEFDLTDALIKEIEARSPYKVMTEARADTVLIGEIRNIELDQLSKSPLTGLSEEVIVSLTIDFEWKDLRTGRPIIVRKNFTGYGLFVPSRPTGESIQLGRFAAVQHLARDLVNELQAQW